MWSNVRECKCSNELPTPHLTVETVDDKKPTMHSKTSSIVCMYVQILSGARIYKDILKALALYH